MFLLIPLIRLELSCLYTFTFHDVSINTDALRSSFSGSCHFTFHDVSINTNSSEYQNRFINSLHSTMFLLILERSFSVSRRLYHSLHSTMFLLIPGYQIPFTVNYVFTFHDVSINTCLTEQFGPCGIGLYIPRCFY